MEKKNSEKVTTKTTTENKLAIVEDNEKIIATVNEMTVNDKLAVYAETQRQLLNVKDANDLSSVSFVISTAVKMNDRTSLAFYKAVGKVARLKLWEKDKKPTKDGYTTFKNFPDWCEYHYGIQRAQAYNIASIYDLIDDDGAKSTLYHVEQDFTATQLIDFMRCKYLFELDESGKIKRTADGFPVWKMVTQLERAYTESNGIKRFTGYKESKDESGNIIQTTLLKELCIELAITPTISRNKIADIVKASLDKFGFTITESTDNATTDGEKPESTDGEKPESTDNATTDGEKPTLIKAAYDSTRIVGTDFLKDIVKAFESGDDNGDIIAIIRGLIDGTIIHIIKR